jgi:hypothetical protein
MSDLPPELEDITSRDGWETDERAWEELLRRWVRLPSPHITEVRLPSGR